MKQKRGFKRYTILITSKKVQKYIQKNQCEPLSALHMNVLIASVVIYATTFILL